MLGFCDMLQILFGGYFKFCIIWLEFISYLSGLKKTQKPQETQKKLSFVNSLEGHDFEFCKFGSKKPTKRIKPSLNSLKTNNLGF